MKIQTNLIHSTPLSSGEGTGVRQRGGLERDGVRPKEGSWRSIRDRAREQRADITRDTKTFAIMLSLFTAIFIAMLFIPAKIWETIDNIHPLVMAIITFWIFAIITIKIIVGKRKMW